MRKKFCLQLVTPTLTLLVVLVYGLVSVTKETLNNEAFTSTVAEKLQDRILQAIGMNGGGGKNSNCSCITTPAGGGNMTATAAAEDADAACSRGNNREQLSSFILEYGLNRPHQTLLLTHMESNFVSIFKPRLKIATGSVLKINAKGSPACRSELVEHVLTWTFPRPVKVHRMPSFKNESSEKKSETVGEDEASPPPPPSSSFKDESNEKKSETVYAVGEDEEEYDDSSGSGDYDDYDDDKAANWDDDGGDPGPEAGSERGAF